MHDRSLLSRRASNLGESPTLSLLEKVEGLKARGRPVIEFYIGEPNVGIPANVAAAMKDALDRGRTTYTHQAGIPELRAALSEQYRTRFGLDFRADDIVVTSGPKDTIFKLLATLVDPGDRVAIVDPHWEAYGEQVKFFGGEPLFVPRRPDSLAYALDDLEAALRKRPKALVLTDPDNPTGYRAAPEELEAIAGMARRHGVLILSDEIYWLHCYGKPYRSVAHDYPEGTIVLGGASKAWAGTGLRIGFALFPAGLSLLARGTARVTGQASSSVNTPAQHGIVEALTGPATRAWEERMVAEFRARRDLVQARLGHLLGYELGGAFYAAPRTPVHGEVFAERLLEEEGVAVLPLSRLTGGSHGRFDRRVRLAYVTERPVLEEGLDRFLRLAGRLGD
jgi:aspartate/methionine/tyrosine aminotransferase